LLKVRDKMRAVHSKLGRVNMNIRTRVLAISFVVLILAAVLNVGCSQTGKPEIRPRPTIVVVHGAWGGSWAWRQVEVLLREKGFNVYRPQLTGLGERVHLSKPDIGLSMHIDDVVNTILYEDLHDIVLVGHSYGGMVITGVADRVPDRIRRLVYVDAFVPSDGDSVMSLVGSRGDWFEAHDQRRLHRAHMGKAGSAAPP
jgi:pimeloyl-ACP methyl ester carboxylesterase